MNAFDIRPDVVDVHGYGGDTLTLHIQVSDALIGSRVFTAQVRSSRGRGVVDAEFHVTRVPGVGADLQLLSADTRRLTARGAYSGQWDLQLAMPDGSDPVSTLVTGELKLDVDVTRGAA